MSASFVLLFFLLILYVEKLPLLKKIARMIIDFLQK